MGYYGCTGDPPEKKLDDKFDKWFLENRYLYPRYSYLTDPAYRWRLRDIYRNSYLSTKYDDKLYKFDYSHWRYLYNREREDYRKYLYDRERRKRYEDLSLSTSDLKYKYPYYWDYYYLDPELYPYV